jgi:hypothetical protein
MQTMTPNPIPVSFDSAFLPENIAAFHDRLFNVGAREAASLVRRTAACTIEQAQQFVQTFSTRWDEDPKMAWPRQIKSYPDLVASMIGDPSPNWVTKLTNRRAELLRLMRRGRTLDAARVVEKTLRVDGIAARKFVQRFGTRSHCLVELLRFYDSPKQVANPFADWPPAAPEKVGQIELFMMPAEFSAEIFYGLIGAYDHRSSASMLRKFGQCSPEQAIEIVNLLEDAQALGADSQLLQQAFLRRYPQVVARLEGRPEPGHLERLRPHSEKILSLLKAQRRLPTIRFIESTLNVNRREARFLANYFEVKLASLEDKPASLELQKLEVKPQSAAPAAKLPLAPEVKPPAKPEPAVVKKAPEPPVVEPKASAVIAPPQPQKPESRATVKPPRASSTHVKAEPVAPPRVDFPPIPDLISFSASPAVATIVGTSGSTSDFFSHDATKELASLAPLEVRQIESLDDAIELLDMLSEVLDKEGPEQAQLLYAQLEQTGFSRAWLVGQAPMMDKLLPSEPWKERLPVVLPMLRSLKTMAKTKPQPQQVLAVLDQALEQGAAGHLASEIASHIDPQDLIDIQSLVSHGNFSDAIPKLEKLLQASEGEAILRKKIPIIDRVFGAEPITAERIRNLAKEPHLFLVALLEKKSPELLAQLDTVKLGRLLAGLPQLKTWLKQMQFHKASVFLFKELKLGPSDISNLLKVIREIV